MKKRVNIRFFQSGAETHRPTLATVWSKIKRMFSSRGIPAQIIESPQQALLLKQKEPDLNIETDPSKPSQLPKPRARTEADRSNLDRPPKPGVPEADKPNWIQPPKPGVRTEADRSNLDRPPKPDAHTEADESNLDQPPKPDARTEADRSNLDQLLKLLDQIQTLAEMETNLEIKQMLQQIQEITSKLSQTINAQISVPVPLKLNQPIDPEPAQLQPEVINNTFNYNYDNSVRYYPRVGEDERGPRFTQD